MWTRKVMFLQRPSEACRMNLGSRHQWWHANLCTHGVSDIAMCPVVCAVFNHFRAWHIFFWFIQATFVDLLKHAVRKLWRAMSHHPCVQVCCFHAVQILESSRMPAATTDFARKKKTIVKNEIVWAREMAQWIRHLLCKCEELSSNP